MNQEYRVKEKYNIVIPQNLFQTWHTKWLPPLMYNAIKKLRAQNPRFHYKLFDDNDCREFIKVYFDADVLNAFDKLIPGAYKADLFRYCVLYKFGGIYLDIKYIHANNFKLINLLEKEHWVLDADNTGIYNALMVCNQGNPILYKAIYKVVENVRNRYYGTSILEPTGPMLLSQFFSEEDKRRFDIKHVCHNYENGRFILFHDYIIFKTYPGYLREQDRYKKVPRYTDLWHRRQIYK